MSISSFIHDIFFPESQTFQLFHHALATPITSVLCHISELEKSKNHHDKLQILKKLECATKRISNLADSFLLSKNLKRRSSFVVHSTLSTVSTLFTHKKADITWVTSTSMENATLSGNQLLFEEALVCLINNALDSYEVTSDKIVIISARTRDAVFEIRIRDYGKGIRWWQKPLIFFPSVSFKEKGNGVGLSFAKNVIEKIFLGKILIETSTLNGTEVICQLPLNP